MPTALSDDELDAMVEYFDALVGRSLRRAIKAGTSEALTASIETFHGTHDQKSHGRGGSSSPLIDPSNIRTRSDLEAVASSGQLPADNDKWEHYYHSTRSSSDLDGIATSGVQPGGGTDRVWLSKDEIRDRNGGFVIVRVPRGQAVEGKDFVESGLIYREFTVDSVPPENVIRGIRSVRDSTGFQINEDKLAEFALQSQNPADAVDLPSEYRGWFSVDNAITAASMAGPEQIDSTTGEPHTGAMIALIPKDPENWALPYPNAEPHTALHVTLAYLGDADDIPDHVLSALEDSLNELSERWHPIEGNVFGTSIWNAESDKPSLNLSVGGEAVDFMHDYIRRLLFNIDEDFDWEPPENHAPWAAHMCLSYNDPEALKELLDKAMALEGPIEFDRIRLAYGNGALDFLLGGVDDT